MKTPKLNSSLILVGTAVVFSMLLASAPCAADDSTPPRVVEGSIPQSVFQTPGPGFDGRDPFYPESDRVNKDIAPVVASIPAGGDLVLKAISGTASRPLAMINGVTFEVGEERVIRTGIARVRVRLMSVDVEALKVTIEVGNETRELRLHDDGANSAAMHPAADAETAQLTTPGKL